MMSSRISSIDRGALAGGPDSVDAFRRLLALKSLVLGQRLLPDQ